MTGLSFGIIIHIPRSRGRGTLGTAVSSTREGGVLFSLLTLLNTGTHRRTSHTGILSILTYRESFCKLNLVWMAEVVMPKGHLSRCGMATHLLSSLQPCIVPDTETTAVPCSRPCIWMLQAIALGGQGVGCEEQWWDRVSELSKLQVCHLKHHLTQVTSVHV